MSNRALRRLQVSSELETLSLDDNIDLDNEEDENENSLKADDNKVDVADNEDNLETEKKKQKKKVKRDKGPVNLFDLLIEDNGGPEEQQAEDGETKPDEEVTNIEQISKKKKKKKRKGKGVTDTDADTKSLPEPQDEIEASLQEVNRLLGEPGVGINNCNSSSHSVISTPLLQIEYRNLNPENELRRIFGAEVVRSQGQSHNRRRNQPVHRGGRLVQPKDNWHGTGGSGLTMKNLGGNEGFAFEHSPAYQDVQYKYYAAVQSGNPELIFIILRDHPYHIDTLLQMSDFYRMNEDNQTSAECIEKALFGLESAFSVMFNMATGNCHLDYRRQENRALHICLFKHILNIGRRGCYRTAFELCKLLISLDAEKDPLNAMYLIDFYALRSGQYDFLLRLHQETRTSETPVIERINFAFSIPLAMFYIASSKRENTEEADKLLQDRLLMYPVVLKSMLDKCSVQPDKRVDGHPFLKTNELNDETRELNRLVSIYVERCHPCWKEAEVMTWLEKNVKVVLDIADAGQDPRLKDYASKRAARFKGATPALLRHYVLCEIPNIGLPRSARNLSSDVLQVTDPFPPSDAITSYDKQRVRPASATAPRRSNMLGLLLESLLPTFNTATGALEGAEPPHANAVAEEAPEGARAIPHNIQHSVNAIMDAMRQLLTDIRVEAPLPPNPENEEDNPVNEEEWED